MAAGNATGSIWHGSRRRREVGDHESNVNSLADDPLHLVQGKREEKDEKDVDETGM